MGYALAQLLGGSLWRIGTVAVISMYIGAKGISYVPWLGSKGTEVTGKLVSEVSFHQSAEVKRLEAEIETLNKANHQIASRNTAMRLTETELRREIDSFKAKQRARRTALGEGNEDIVECIQMEMPQCAADLLFNIRNRVQRHEEAVGGDTTDD